MTTPKSGISVIVPVFNSAPLIVELVERIRASVQNCTDRFEVILVNDHSYDESWSAIESVCEKFPFVVGINLARNSGQHNALLCGVRCARYPVCITLDDDLQFLPEDFPLLLAKLDEGADLVYGTPQQQQHGLWRNFASKATKLALGCLIDSDIAQHLSPFRALRTVLRNAFTDARCDVSLFYVLLSWGTTRYASVQVRHVPRTTGKSNYSVTKLVLCAVNMITGFTTIPLKIATAIGIVCVCFGIILLAYVVYSFIHYGGSVPGFPFLASVIIIFSGAQLFALGIIGEYVGRMYSRTLSRPSYVIDRILRSSHSSIDDSPDKPSLLDFEPQPSPALSKVEAPDVQGSFAINSIGIGIPVARR